ncbi:serine/threonine-protein kinase haspin homolog [Rutidosis leptorrhynchoides]|uniref:serine/threonine-protein kinase haspin homolog n=1 Tax=Rutidosis leptorrhynchoides TaxID=125765 RepID=UPI003A9903AC
MTSRTGHKGDDIWLQISATESNNQLQEQEIAIVYRRKNPQKESLSTTSTSKQVSVSQKNRVSFAPAKRISWNRSLFTRGRTSIAVAASTEYGPQKEKRTRKNKPPLPRAKGVPPQNYEKECAYFKEVDEFELLEESPSPQNKTWVMGTKDRVPETHLSSMIKKWLITLKHNHNYAPSPSLSRILETPAQSHNSIYNGVLDFTSLKTSRTDTGPNYSQSKQTSGVIASNNRSDIIETVEENDSEDVEFGIRNLSLSSRESLLSDQPWDPLLALLTLCGQSSPTSFSDVLSAFCDLESIAKVGEGTYGEVFIAGGTVCKVVPFDGDSLVNNEIQKKAEDLLEEVMLMLTLNQLRGNNNQTRNVCPTFIQTLSLRVCDGNYDDAMIRAWDEWDKENISQNDHPNEFAEKQRFVVFVQEHGGKDLESFVLLSFDEARSLLVQITVALAVAEAAFEFEHRDLHWGNILLNRKGSDTLQFIVDGKKVHVKTYGLVASIIDFTLSRMNTGEDILFLDLSLDQGLFEGPKGDKQSETYRKMKEVTEDCWEASFPKTNVLWLQYLVDILLIKKVYDRTSKDERELRSLKKRLNGYESAKESMIDPFFSDLIVSD